MFRNVIVAALLATSSDITHSIMFQPTLRKNQDSAYTSTDENACGYDGTDIPPENNFQLLQLVFIYFWRLGWWNNHDGGFIKMALIKTTEDDVPAKEQQYFLRNENSS